MMVTCQGEIDFMLVKKVFPLLVSPRSIFEAIAFRVCEMRVMLEYHKVAIFYSAAVLVIVVSSLIFARHPSLHSIGIITLIGMASTILITYSLQPWLFRLLCRSKAMRQRFKIPDKEK